MVGGMASVVEQTLAMEYDRRYRAALFPITMRQAAGEGVVHRLVRHAGHMARLRATLRTLQPAVVHIHTCSGFSLFRSAVDMYVARRAGCPVVLHIHGAGFDTFFAEANPVSRAAIRSVLNKADAVVALSRTWQAKLHTMARRANVVTIENAIMLPELPTHREATGPCHFVLLAKMDTWKGIDDLLDACVLLHNRSVDVRLTLAGPPGSAGDENTLHAKISSRQLADMVTYIGPVRGEAKARLLHGADAYVQPSHQEGMPISLLEAMAYGLPIVATQVGGVPEMLGDDTAGLLVPPHNPPHLADAMTRLVLDGHLRKSMSEAAREAATVRFSIRRFEQNLIQLYDHLLAGRQQPVAASPIRA